MSAQNVIKPSSHIKQHYKQQYKQNYCHHYYKNKQNAF